MSTLVRTIRAIKASLSIITQVATYRHKVVLY